MVIASSLPCVIVKIKKNKDINYVNYCFNDTFTQRKQQLYNKKNTHKSMEGTNITPKNEPDLVILYILVVIWYRTSKDTPVTIDYILDSTNKVNPDSWPLLVKTRENYEERYIYKVETTRDEMKHLYKKAGSECEEHLEVRYVHPREYDNWIIVASSPRAVTCQNGEAIVTRTNSSIAKKTFTSPINLEDGITNTYLGKHKSTMELFKYNGIDIDEYTDIYMIEWDIK